LTRGLGKLGLYFLGWRVEGRFPNHPKLVIAGAPHSTNWDFPVAMSVAFAFNLRINFLAKHKLFEGGLGPIMRWFGGLPVDRGMAADVVAQVVESFATRDAIWLCISPEGTRKQVERFRSGFLRIAAGAEVPILLLVFDHRARAIRLGPLCLPGPDSDRDREVIERWYRPYQVVRSE
jgi:1-acyl-sn-glycerol-3-phosphate acyltransferase